MGFEPTRAEHIGLAVQRLNHSATQSLCCGEPKFFDTQQLWCIKKFRLSLTQGLGGRVVKALDC